MMEYFSHIINRAHPFSESQSRSHLVCKVLCCILFLWLVIENKVLRGTKGHYSYRYEFTMWEDELIIPLVFFTSCTKLS